MKTAYNVHFTLYNQKKKTTLQTYYFELTCMHREYKESVCDYDSTCQCLVP